METTGVIHGISIDFGTHKQVLSLQLNTDVRDQYDLLKDAKLLDISVKIHRDKRTKDAN